MTLPIFLVIIFNAVAAGLNVSLALINYRQGTLTWLPLNIVSAAVSIAVTLWLIFGT